MPNKSVYFGLPLKNNLILRTNSIKVPFYEETIYDALGFFEDEIFLKSRFNLLRSKITRDIPLRGIINLHDEDGLKLKKISSMIKPISHGQHVFSKSGIPNIKLINSQENKWVVFDGHHTLMSYMFLKKTHLSQIPHLVINGENGFFQDKEINVLFGKHVQKLNNKDWRSYVINCYEKGDNQLSIRKRNNAGELFDALKDKISNF